MYYALIARQFFRGYGEIITNDGQIGLSDLSNLQIFGLTNRANHKADIQFDSKIGQFVFWPVNRIL